MAHFRLPTSTKTSSGAGPERAVDRIKPLLLDITPGLRAGVEAIEAAGVWAIVERQKDVVGAMRLDAVDEMTETLDSPYVNDVNVHEIAEGDDDTMEHGGGASPPYVALSSHFDYLESLGGDVRQ